MEELNKIIDEYNKANENGYVEVKIKDLILIKNYITGLESKHAQIIDAIKYASDTDSPTLHQIKEYIGGIE